MGLMFSIFIIFPLWAGDAVLERAQQLTLAQNREGAVQAILSGIRTEKPGSANAKRWIKALGDATEIFYSEKAQKLYLEAEAQAELRPKAAIDHLEDVRRMEPGNVRVLRTLAHVRLLENECPSGATVIAEGLRMNPFAMDLQVAEIYGAICSGKIGIAKDLILKRSETFKILRGGNELSQIWLAAQKKDSEDLRKRSLDFYNVDPDNPEAIYWVLHSGVQTPQQRKDLSEKFLVACTRDSSSVRRKYNWIPTVCTQRKEVEDLRGTL